MTLRVLIRLRSTPAFAEKVVFRSMGLNAVQVRQVPLRLLAQLVQDGEALGRADDHLGRAGGAVHERILARLIEVEAVMRMLERGHPQAPRDQARQRLGDQRGLARSAPAGEADDAHGVLIAASFGSMHSCRAKAKRPAGGRRAFE